ncbi:YGGT family protein [Hibiscus syriacus]|uniref:YGGT family protein n=1 Tax=Hibiscus syriacus TaxID=106335 RepID=A0A6A3A7J1_HIBSY|nr:YGGT family protein [Hibiscus syriacus]
MNSIATYRSRRPFEKWVAIVLTVLAVVSPLYVNQKPSYEPELEDQSMDFTSWLFLLLLLLALALAFWFYLDRSFTSFDRRWTRPSRYSSHERLAAIGLIVLGVLSPLYMNKGTVSELEPDEQSINFGSWLPLLLLILIMAIAFSLCCDGSFTSIDPNWIHRVGGSSAGVLLLLLVLAVVLKCKTSGMS